MQPNLSALINNVLLHSVQKDPTSLQIGGALFAACITVIISILYRNKLFDFCALAEIEQPGLLWYSDYCSKSLKENTKSEDMCNLVCFYARKVSLIFSVDLTSPPSLLVKWSFKTICKLKWKVWNSVTLEPFFYWIPSNT